MINFNPGTVYVYNDVVVKCCPNRKVAYLAIHSKKRRTRKKNVHRAIKILEELANDCD